MTVITMTREMGSLGKDVAAGVAQAMGLEVIHHEVIERDVAGRMRLGESDVHRFLEGKPSLLDRWKIDKHKLSRYTAEEIYDIAAKDNVVIRGWGATALLRKVPHVLRVRVCAPMAFRIRVLQDRLKIDDEQFARREIERNDAAHTRAMHDFVVSGAWQNALNYDLVLNTERLPVDDCVQQVIALAKSAVFEKTARSRQILADLMIESRIHTMIANREITDTYTKNVDITVVDGNVVVSGAADSKESGNALCRQLQEVEGVNSVSNKLVVLHTYRG